MSNVKTSNIETIIRTVLEENPAIKAKDLRKKLGDKTGLSRSTIYYHLSSLETRGGLYRDKGRYWIEKPRKETEYVKSGFGFFEWMERRAERKRLEKEEKNRAIDRQILRIRREGAARKEINCLPSNIKGFARTEKENEIKRKYELL
jgi:DNA-binding transcriptional ArsR family regulator